MTGRLVYLSGEPGVGKSTLMARLTDGLVRHPLPAEDDAPVRDLLAAPGTLRPVAVELGRRRDAFSGTDSLPSAVITVAERYVRRRAADEAPLLLAEGARLANRRFLTAAVAAGWHTTLVHLRGPHLAAERRAQRAAALGRPEQHAGWVKGRRTAADNLARDCQGWGVRLLVVDADAVTAPGPVLSRLIGDLLDGHPS